MYLILFLKILFSLEASTQAVSDQALVPQLRPDERRWCRVCWLPIPESHPYVGHIISLSQSSSPATLKCKLWSVTSLDVGKDYVLCLFAVPTTTKPLFTLLRMFTLRRTLFFFSFVSSFNHSHLTCYSPNNYTFGYRTFHSVQLNGTLLQLSVFILQKSLNFVNNYFEVI